MGSISRVQGPCGYPVCTPSGHNSFYVALLRNDTVTGILLARAALRLGAPSIWDHILNLQSLRLLSSSLQS